MCHSSVALSINVTLTVRVLFTKIKKVVYGKIRNIISMKDDIFEFDLFSAVYVRSDLVNYLTIFKIASALVEKYHSFT